MCSWKFPVGYFTEAQKSIPQDNTKYMPDLDRSMTNFKSQVSLFLSKFNILKFYTVNHRELFVKKERFVNAQC